MFLHLGGAVAVVATGAWLDTVAGLVAGGIGLLFARAATGENGFKVHDQLLSQLLTGEERIYYSRISCYTSGG